MLKSGRGDSSSRYRTRRFVCKEKEVGKAALVSGFLRSKVRGIRRCKEATFSQAVIDGPRPVEGLFSATEDSRDGATLVGAKGLRRAGTLLSSAAIPEDLDWSQVRPAANVDQGAFSPY